MGQQGAHICDVIFDNVRVPVENRLGREGEGFKVAMQVLDRGRLHISAVCVGVAERLIKDSVEYASDRKQFGQNLSQFQLVQGMIADCKTEALAAKALTMETARKRDAGESVTMEAPPPSTSPRRWWGRVADKAVQIFGGAGYIAEYGIERFYRDVRIFRIYEGTSQIQQVVIARETLKRGG
jgi:acyl-CoA dehydrogenase